MARRKELPSAELWAAYAHAEHRASLAEGRADKWADEAMRLMARASSTRSARWAREYVRQAERAMKLGATAERELRQWTQSAALLAERASAQQQREEEEEAKRKAPPPPPKRHRYVVKVKYTGRGRRGSKPKHHHVWWDVWVSKVGYGEATEQELAMVVRYIRNTGEVPEGWRAENIMWDRGTRDSFDEAPSRTPTFQSTRDVLAQLSPTLGRDEGADYEIGEVID